MCHADRGRKSGSNTDAAKVKYTDSVLLRRSGGGGEKRMVYVADTDF